VKNYNQSIGTLPSVSRPGYTFAGWFTAASGGTKITSTKIVTGNATYYAQWTQNEFTLTFSANGGETVSPSQIIKEYYQSIGILPTATRTGYSFVGWFTAASGGTEINSSKIVTSDQTYYAHWTINSYTATFDSNGGSSASPVFITKDYGNPLGQLPTVTRVGYNFDGWFSSKTGGSKIDGTTNMSKDVIYYAHWQAMLFSVDFDSHGGNVVVRQDIGHNETLGDLVIPHKSGYKFAGWWTEAQGGVKISANTKITSDVTYHAHWTKTYLVKFNSKGGKSIAKKTIEKNKKLGKLKTPTKKGYKFLGWYTKAKGGKKITKNTVVKKNVTYYAHWKRKH
jgi:uncharacterized repeat protein (TIGR02543 family)